MPGDTPRGNFTLVGDWAGMVNVLGTSRATAYSGGGCGERRGWEGVTGLGLESGLKVCSLELGGCGETCAEEPEDGDIGYRRMSLCGASSIPMQQNNIHNTLYLNTCRWRWMC